MSGVNYDDLYEEFLILTSSSYSSSEGSPRENLIDPSSAHDSPATSPFHHFESISPLRVVSSIDPMMSTVTGRSVSPWGLQDEEKEIQTNPTLQLVDDGTTNNSEKIHSSSVHTSVHGPSVDLINNNSQINESPHLRAQLTQNYSIPTSSGHYCHPDLRPQQGQQFNRECWNDNQRYHQIRPSPSSMFGNSNGSNVNNQFRPSWNPNEPNRPLPRPLWLGSGEPPIFPGGLENLWREMPKEYQKLITPQDVPETARFRGYFTVCELLALKRSLQAKFPAYAKFPVKKEQQVNENKRKEPPTNRGGGKKYCTGISETTVVKVNKREMGQAAKLAAANNSANNLANNYPMATTTNGDLVGAVKEALRVLDDDGQGMDKRDGEDYDIREEETKIGSTVFRTTTIVFRLLQIGNFHFRSFVENHPNRLRVLFNTQKITYECQLPVFQPVGLGASGSNEIYQPLKKLLLVTINFDQITMVQFGDDKLFMRVEGAPLLTVTYSPAGMDEGNVQNLTPQEQYLLDQIDKGQLKLTACHQIFFINERMVTVLENQFKEHPKFRNIMTRIP